jgi:phosphoglucan,water dikinase
MTTIEPQREADFTRQLVEAHRARKSWRERLQWIRDRLVDPAFNEGPGPLVTIAIYLRLLATGELACAEDGRHFRPSHHAEAARQIEAALDRLTTPQTAWILRRIYPYLPSWDDEFRRSEPLTRIRDIAHRNDIPADLKKEIKHRLQNKLHRCAGPEDLQTSAELLQRITAPGAPYAADFVREFQTFHAELLEFFNASAVETRLQKLARWCDADTARAIQAFLAMKGAPRSEADALSLLDRLTETRRRLAAVDCPDAPHRRSQVRLADIGLEDFAFALLSDCVNRLEADGARQNDAAPFLRPVCLALENVRLSGIEPEECAALYAEMTAWSQAFSPDDRLHLMRLLASLTRARRVAESYTDRILLWLPPRVAELGRALDIPARAITVFAEGDIRGHVVFQLSRLLDHGRAVVRRRLQLPPWEAIVPGTAEGKVVQPADLADVEQEPGPLLVLLENVDGDAEIPSGVKGIALGHPLPHLSHLGVRARQARIPFLACTEREHLKTFAHLTGKFARLSVNSGDCSLQEIASLPTKDDAAGTETTGIVVPEVVLATQATVIPLAEALPATCGSKAAGAFRLQELAEQSGGLFRTPRGLAVPFGIMEKCLADSPQRDAYHGWLDELERERGPQRDLLLQRLSDVVRNLVVPGAIQVAVKDFFAPDDRLAVRSSANGEDLEHLAGAGLYDSVLNVPPARAAAAIAQVWASLWTRRAVQSRVQAGIPNRDIHMAVLLQQMLDAELSFVMHTTNPLTGNRAEALVELAVGLGETLASSASPGTPYRLSCQRPTGNARLLACADFSFALRPGRSGDVFSIIQDRLNYAKVPLSADPAAIQALARKLAAIADFLEGRLNKPQDVEGVCIGQEIHLVQSRPQQGLP